MIKKSFSPQLTLASNSVIAFDTRGPLHIIGVSGVSSSRFVATTFTSNGALTGSIPASLAVCLKPIIPSIVGMLEP